MDSNTTKKKSKKCAMCSKKVGLLGFTCRCGGVYCGVHRYEADHDCSFNFADNGMKILEKKLEFQKTDKSLII